jgi:anti-sigma factor RsiW
MTPHENCRYLLSSLSEFVDGELDHEICQEIENHMADCVNCQIVVNTLQKTVELYHETADPPDLPSDVKSRLIKRLALEDYLKE